MTSAWISVEAKRPSAGHRDRALRRQASLTKPAGSLGSLETLAVDLAALQHRDCPSARTAPIIIFAGDHGVTVQGVSAFPAAVTVQMLANFVAGGAAISVLARELGSLVHIVDVGTLATSPVPGVVADKSRCGTNDFSLTAAMTAIDVAFALSAGRRAVERVAIGADILILGEMGIGNTTSASAMLAALTGREAATLVGAGTGLDAQGLSRKSQVIAHSLVVHGMSKGAHDPSRVIETVGGLEIAALAGAIIASAQQGIPVLIDGFIVTVAALTAVRLNASCRPWLIFSHHSAERGHTAALAELDAAPLLNLGMRLGEASGAAVALPLLRHACSLHNGMGNFEDAGVSGRTAS
jgi:nicotinate-nucleotide--dimethylbenzimidazole phosphoribosyltransferase